MAVAFDAAGLSHVNGSSANEASFTITHNPVADLSAGGGVAVIVCTRGSQTDHIASVTYDGEAMSRITGGDPIVADDNAGEGGRADLFFLGSGINATDPATITVNRTNNTTPMWAASISVTADTDTEIPSGSISLIEASVASTEQNCDDGSPGTNSLRIGGGYSDRGAPDAAGANSTFAVGNDEGGWSCSIAYETTPGQGSRPVGLADASSDETAYVHFAISEVAGPSSFTQETHRFRNDDGALSEPV